MDCEFNKIGCNARLSNSDHAQSHAVSHAGQHVKLLSAALENVQSENKHLNQKVDSLDRLVKDHDRQFSDLSNKFTKLQDSFEKSLDALRSELSSKDREYNKNASSSSLDNKLSSAPSSTSANSSTPRATNRVNEPAQTRNPVPSPTPTPTPNTVSESDRNRLGRMNSIAGGVAEVKPIVHAAKSPESTTPNPVTSSTPAVGGVLAAKDIPVGFEKAILWGYDPVTDEWCRGTVMFKMEKTAFAEGALRAAHKAEVRDKVTGCDTPPDPAVSSDKTFKVGALPSGLGLHSDKYVIKLSKKPVPPERYFEDVKMQMLCAEIGAKFNKGMPKPVTFLHAWVLEIPKNPSVYAGLEPFIEGEFIKFNSNYGAVLSERNTPQAFSHFTWEQSNHSLLVIDLQGVKDFYTDPQIHTKDGKGFGLGNLGMNGIDRFLKTHKCNPICQMLNLPMINIATDTSKKKVALMKGTMKVPFIEDQLGFGGIPKWEGPTNFSNGEFTCTATLSGHPDRVMSLWTTPKQLFVGVADGEIRVWNLSTLQMETSIMAHRKSVECMCSNEAYLFSCSTDHSIKVWDLRNFELIAPLRDHTQEVYSIVLTDRTLGFLISASSDKTIKVWNIRNWKCQNSLEGHSKAIKTLAVSGSILFSGSNEGTIMVWNLKYMSCIFTIDAHEGWVKSLAVKDKFLYSGAFDYLIKEWDITSFNLNSTYSEHNDDVLSVWANDKFLVSACNDRSIIVWDYNTKKSVAVLKAAHRSAVSSVTTEGSRIFSGSEDCNVKVWQWTPK